MTFKQICAGLLAAGLFSFMADAAVRPQLTRVVAYAEDKETTVGVINDSDTTYMLQSWLEDLQGRDSGIPLVLTPPVMKMEGKSEGKLRLVVMRGEIPQDRESVYWLSLQEIPPKAKDTANRLVVAVRSRIKVFVRPAGLTSEGARASAGALRWSLQREGSQTWLVATNPTPYYISFGRLTAGCESCKKVTPENKNTMVPPKGSQRYSLPSQAGASPVAVTWSATNDWGGAGEEHSQEVRP